MHSKWGNFIAAISGIESDVTSVAAQCKSPFGCRLQSVESTCITFILSCPRKPQPHLMITDSQLTALSSRTLAPWKTITWQEKTCFFILKLTFETQADKCLCSHFVLALKQWNPSHFEFISQRVCQNRQLRLSGLLGWWFSGETNTSCAFTFKLLLGINEEENNRWCNLPGCHRIQLTSIT